MIFILLLEFLISYRVIVKNMWKKLLTAVTDENEIPICFYQELDNIIYALDVDESHVIEHDEFMLLNEVMSGMRVGGVQLRIYDIDTVINRLSEEGAGLKHPRSNYPIFEEMLMRMADDVNLPKSHYCTMTRVAFEAILKEQNCFREAVFDFFKTFDRNKNRYIDKKELLLIPSLF